MFKRISSFHLAALTLVLGLLQTIQTNFVQLASGLERFYGDRGDSRLILYLCETFINPAVAEARCSRRKRSIRFSKPAP